MKRQRDSSVESARSSDVPPPETEKAPVKLTARDRAYETVISTLRKKISELQSGSGLPKNEDPLAADETVRKLQDDNDKLTTKIKQMETKMNSEIEKARTEMIKLKDQLGQRDTHIRALLKEKGELISTNESLDQKLSATVQECNLQTNLRQRLRENYDNLMREFQRASERGDAFVQKIYTLQGELERLESTKRELVEEVARLSKIDRTVTFRGSNPNPGVDPHTEVDYG